MNKTALIIANVALWFGAIGCYALPYALERSEANSELRAEQRAIDALSDDSDDYEQSEQYQTIKAANESLKRIKDGGL